MDFCLAACIVFLKKMMRDKKMSQYDQSSMFQNGHPIDTLGITSSTPKRRGGVGDDEIDECFFRPNNGLSAKRHNSVCLYVRTKMPACIDWTDEAQTETA